MNEEKNNNCIVLINGTKLNCYPKGVQPTDYSTDDLSLDTTGEYFAAGKKPETKKTIDKVDVDENYFYQHAYLFYRHASHILNDSRMFLAPVPVQSGLAYTGTSGFHNPTLGIYIEWWLNCGENVTHDNDGNEALTCRLAGSPLSGGNACTCAYPDGRAARIVHHHFKDLWQSFIGINNRYKDAKARYEAYTLDEVVAILSATDESRESELETRLAIAEGNAQTTKTNHSRLKKQYDNLQKQFQSLVMLHFKPALEVLRHEYRIKKQEADRELAVIEGTKREVKSRMKQGVITPNEYQRAITPLTKRKKEIEAELRRFRIEKAHGMVETGYITYSQVDDYICRDDAKKQSSD